MSLTVSSDIMKYRESTSDPWKRLIIQPSGNTMYYPSQTVNVASNAEMFRITDPAITTQTVVVELTFANPSYVTSGVTWTSYDGYIAFNGTCTTATTANVTLGNAKTPTPQTPLAIANGGTGADNASDARANLGALGLESQLPYQELADANVIAAGLPMLYHFTGTTLNTAYKEGVGAASEGWIFSWIQPTGVWGEQIAVGFGDPALLIRNLSSGVWSAWGRIT